MEWFFGKVWKTPRSALAYRLILTLTVLSSVGLVILHTGICLSRTQPVFRPTGELESIGWLASNSAPEETVLAGRDTSVYIPAAIGHRVFWGHWSETIDAQQKRKEFTKFFDQETSDDWRLHFLQRYGIRYLLHGPHGATGGQFDPSQAAYLAKRFQSGEYAIYEVERFARAMRAAKSCLAVADTCVTPLGSLSLPATG
jgi:hypothetical protein